MLGAEAFSGITVEPNFQPWARLLGDDAERFGMLPLRFVVVNR